MGNETEVGSNIKTDTTSQAKADSEQGTALIADNTTALKLGAEKPSSLMTVKNQFEPLRPTKGLISGEEIHGVHLVFFVGILAFLFFGMWKFGKKTKF